jgi:phospholipase/carboxylesterase
LSPDGLFSPFPFGPEGGVEKAIPAPISGTVILMHGLGADGQDFVPALPYLRLEGSERLRFLFPNAQERPVGVNRGMKMRAWYDIPTPDVRISPDWDGIRSSARRILEWVELERSRGIPADRIFLAGFSQGGLVAINAALMYGTPLGGVLALSTYDPEPDSIVFRAKGSPPIRFLMAHGREDAVIPLPLGKVTYRALEKAGWKGEWKEYDNGHSVTLEELSDVGRWFSGGSAHES